MSFRRRIAAWVVISSIVLISVMISTAYYQLEEELREGSWDRTHPKIPGWVLHNSYSEEEIQDILGELLQTWLWTAAPLVGLSLGAGLLLAHRSLRPVHDINRQLARMRANALRSGVTVAETDPIIADLVNHLNSLLDRAGTAYQEMAEFSANVAHELRTPLMLLRMRLEHVPEGMPVAFREELQDELGRLWRFIERSLVAAKAEQGALIPVPSSLDLSDFVRGMAEDYQLLAEIRSLTVTLDLENDIRIHADSDLLRQALHGLLENAVRYAKSRLVVSLQMESGFPVLSIRNDFNSVTMPKGGLGLGLRLVRGICKASEFPFEVSEKNHDFIASIHFTA